MSSRQIAVFRGTQQLEEGGHLETLLTVYQKTRLHIPESRNLNFHISWIFCCIQILMVCV